MNARQRVAKAKAKRQQHNKLSRGYHKPSTPKAVYKHRGRFMSWLTGEKRKREEEVRKQREEYNERMKKFILTRSLNVTVKKIGLGITRIRSKTGNHYNYMFSGI